ncbi:hypothetical protein EI77_03203 [Prosthecobacter fusiformis]|uniref:Uncharacterized protein n=1 Tax=Prosthecobacter fusiformis TaxID=48464 RepID=A0A4R7RTE0_9BACT|nr:hypothetical protein [Prosthecobacter fusiformis]TDU68086.1 hypothetical protein EI77_03203 [Prosthecobacter fusiformis]
MQGPETAPDAPSSPAASIDEDSISVVEVAEAAPPFRAPTPTSDTLPQRNPLIQAWSRIGGGSLALSLLIHLGIIFAGGLIVFTTAIQEKAVDFLPGGGSPQGDKASQALSHQVQQKRQSTLNKKIPRQRLVSTNLNSAISLPDSPPDLLDVPDVSSMLGSGKLSTTMGASSLSSFGPGSGLGSMSGITFQPITMFGKEMKDTRRIAVVMDVSRSMTKYLPAVVAELDKIARQSVLVLYFGCGLNEPKERIDDKIRKTAGDDFASFWQNWEGKASIKLTADERKKLKYDPKQPMPLEAIYKKLAGRPNTYYIGFNGIGHTQSALMCNEITEADTVYWFADFQDAVTEDVMNQVRRKLKYRKQKLYMHASVRGRSFDKVREGLVIPLGGEVMETEVKAAK